MADKAAERIKYMTEVLRLLVVLTIAIGGGTLSLLLGELTTFRRLLATAGLLVTLGLFVVAWRQHRAIERAIEALPEES
jgi:hypothetical protein